MWLLLRAVLNRKSYPIGSFIGLRILQNGRAIMSQTDTWCLLLCMLQFLDTCTVRNTYGLVRLVVSGDLERLQQELAELYSAC